MSDDGIQVSVKQTLLIDAKQIIDGMDSEDISVFLSLLAEKFDKEFSKRKDYAD